MHLSETRYIFWDGVVNVDTTTGAVDNTLTCRQYYLEANPVPPSPNNGSLAANGLSRAEADAKRQRAIISSCVVPHIKVRINKVDEWFIPLTDMVAIELRLRLIPRIKSLMLRVWDCDPNLPYKLLYQEILRNAEISRIPKVDKSRGEAPAQKQSRTTAHDLHEVKCLSHCYMEVWISESATAFDLCDGNNHPAESNDRPLIVHDKSLPPQNMPDVWSLETQAWDSGSILTSAGAWVSRIKARQPFVDANWQARRAHKEQKHADRLGKNISLAGCRLIEDIMDNKTALTIYDHEPTDRLAPAAPAPLGSPPSKQGDGATVYPDFRRRIRFVLYQICQHTAIGMQVLRDVANTPNRAGKDTRIYIYPSTQVAKFIEGVGVDPLAAPPVVDDYDADTLFQQAKTALRNGTPWPGAGGAVPTDPMPTPQNFRINTPGVVNKPKWLDVAAKRLTNNHIGASDGRGCVGKFFFHPVNMLKCDADAYHVQRHQLVSANPINTWMDHTGVATPRMVNLASKCEYSANKTVKIPIETPFFLAFAHEMIHARRYQLGINGEHEKIELSPVADNHPDSLVAKLANAALRGNFVSRYKTYNVEEFDTIEGRGVTTTLANLSQSACQNLVARGILPAGATPAGPHAVQATENLMRQELNLELRYRYVDDAKDFVQIPSSDIAPRRFIKPRTVKPTPAKLTTATFEDIQSQLNNLHANVALPTRAQALKPGVNYFQYSDPQFGWCYFFAHTFDDRGQQIHATQMFDDIRARYTPPAGANPGIHIAASLNIVSAPIANALAAFEAPLPAGDSTDHKLNAIRNLLAVLIPSDASDDVQRMLSVYRLKDSANANCNANGIEAFGTLKVMPNPNLASITDRAMYLPDHPYDNPKTFCHMLIHESLHMHSFRANGFMAWDMRAGTAIAGHLTDVDPARDAIKATFNEGTTELLARIATYRLNCEYRARGFNIVSEVDVFGGVPSYEYPTHLMCQLVSDLNTAGQRGIALLARAYFEGEWANFNNALAALAAATANQRYTREYFDQVAKVGHQGANYFGANSAEAVAAVTALQGTHGVDWDLPPALVTSTQGAPPTYQDPVFYTGVGGDTIASGMNCDHTDNSPPLPPLKLETECFCCHERINIPTESIRKP